MATVGLVGGLGPESTIDYYRRILSTWQRDDSASAPSIVIDSLDVQHALRLVATDRSALAGYLLESLRRLAAAGSDFAALTANTAHIVFDELAAASPLPLISIVETCAAEARRRELSRVLLLGTRFTMEGSFYPNTFSRSGLRVIVPDDADRIWVHEKYIGELLVGQFLDATRNGFVTLVRRLRKDRGIDGVVLGGTELQLLLPTTTVADLPVLDTMAIHVAAIVERLRSLARNPKTR